MCFPAGRTAHWSRANSGTGCLSTFTHYIGARTRAGLPPLGAEAAQAERVCQPTAATGQGAMGATVDALGAIGAGGAAATMLRGCDPMGCKICRVGGDVGSTGDDGVSIFQAARSPKRSRGAPAAVGSRQGACFRRSQPDFHR